MADRPQNPTPNIVETVADVALELGISQRAVAGNLAAGMPGRTGAYDLVAIRAWREANVKPRPEVRRERAREAFAPAGPDMMALLERFVRGVTDKTCSGFEKMPGVSRQKLRYLQLEAVWIFADIVEDVAGYFNKQAFFERHGLAYHEHHEIRDKFGIVGDDDTLDLDP